MDRYIGLDAHASSCTLAVVGPSGKRLGSHVVETNARALIEVLEPHVEELVVTGDRQESRPEERGHRREALVGMRRTGRAAQDRCDQDARVQGMGPVQAVGESGEGLRLPGGRHRASEEPGQGPIRIAELLPVVVTPYRFRSRSGFWAYCGLGIVMRSSSDWVRASTGEWQKMPVQQTRGLNRNFNHTLKRIFKGAAATVIGRAEDGPLYRHYLSLLDGGTKPNLAKLTSVGWKDAFENTGPTNRKRTGYRGEHPLVCWAGPSGPSPQG